MCSVNSRWGVPFRKCFAGYSYRMGFLAHGGPRPVFSPGPAPRRRRSLQLRSHSVRKPQAKPTLRVRPRWR
eukprot:1497960-Prymnesium_polylepis.1